MEKMGKYLKQSQFECRQQVRAISFSAIQRGNLLTTTQLEKKELTLNSRESHRFMGRKKRPDKLPSFFTSLSAGLRVGRPQNVQLPFLGLGLMMEIGRNIR